MNKLTTLLAIAAGLTAASCSAGHGISSSMPPVSVGGEAQSASAVVGTGTARSAQALAKPPAGWAVTATQAFKPANASDLGVLAGTKTLTVRLGLQMRSQAQLKSLVASGQRISPSAFSSTYAPTSAQVAAATKYLQGEGFTNVTVEPNNLLISANGTVATASKAFSTSIHGFSRNGKTVYANTTPAYVPSALSGNVIAVLGLNDVQTMAAAPKAQPTACNVEGVNTPSQECLRFYDPTTFQMAYDSIKMGSARLTPIAIMAEGDVSGAISNFRLNEKEFKMIDVAVKVVPVGLPSSDTSGDDEWTLDMTYSTGMAANVPELYLYDTTSLTDSDIALEYNRWVTQHETLVGNSSFGGCEYGPYLDGSMFVDDEVLLQAAAEGMTMFASTGDSGGYCSVGLPNGAPGGAPFVNYPAASPYVVAVGGTDLFSNADGTYKGETAWEAGGGGLSQFEAAPIWQSSQPVNGSGVESFRGLPDIAMDGSIETGALLWGGSAANGSCTPCITGGTSLSSPLAAGSWARIQSEHGNSLGFAPPLLYANYTSHAAGAVTAGPPPTRTDGGFNDILGGTNGAYTAAPGYDYTTGLGSLNVAVLGSELK